MAKTVAGEVKRWANGRSWRECALARASGGGRKVLAGGAHLQQEERESLNQDFGIKKAEGFAIFLYRANEVQI